MTITTQNNKLFINGIECPYISFEVYQRTENKWSYRIHCNVDQIEHFISVLQPKGIFGDLTDDTGLVWLYSELYSGKVTVLCRTRDWKDWTLLKSISDGFEANWVTI